MATEKELSREEVRKYLSIIGKELKKMKIEGELVLCGGAVMVLEYNSRKSTRDIDGIFEPRTEIREIASKIAQVNKLDSEWLNDKVKFSKSFSKTLRTNSKFLMRLGNLKVYSVDIKIMIAMKLVAFRILETNDLNDIEALLKTYKNMGNKVTPEILKSIVTEVYGDTSKLKPNAVRFIEKVK